jgi:proline dehydrogenase
VERCAPGAPFAEIPGDNGAEVNALGMILRKLIERAARSYVAGTELSDAIGFARTMERDGTGSTIAYWNDRGEDPLRVHAAYLAAIDGAADAGIHTYISIKAPALSMSQTLTGALAQPSRDRSIGLHFDSLSVEWQTPTLDLIERLVPMGVTLGCTLPGRFAQSLSDAERAVAHRLRVRVVKGQWEDPQHTVEPRLGFMAVIDRLAGRAAHVAVATHDSELAEEALARLAARGTPAELELLFGLPVHGARDVARRLKVPVRIYVPYGHAWLPYALSAARKNPRVLYWILEDAVRGRTLRANRRL